MLDYIVKSNSNVRLYYQILKSFLVIMCSSVVCTSIVLLICLIFVCDGSLQQVHVLFRHGARTPNKDNMYPTDPYWNDTWYPAGLGALTNLGKTQEFNIGLALRSKYGKFLGDIYTPEVLHARSTNYDRTKMSLELVLAGLWPPIVPQQWNSLLAWQPIPFNYEPYEKDKLLGFPISYCPDIYEEYQKSISTDEVKYYLKENSDIFAYINENSGLNATTTLDLMTLYFGLFAEDTDGRLLPEWTEKVYPKFLSNATNFEYKIQTSNNILVKSTGGPLIKKIIQDSETAIKNNIFSPKLYLYSAHEYNLAYVLSALQVFEPHVPPYSSYIVFELHKNLADQYSFKISYQDYHQDSPEVLIIPGCGEEFCSIVKFKEVTAGVIPEKEWC